MVFSSRFSKLVTENRSAWRAGVAVVIAGTAFKVFRIKNAISCFHVSVGWVSLYVRDHFLYICPQVLYFNFSRGVLVEHMDRRHLQATEHLASARQFGSKMAKEREDNRAPQLTPEQQAQLQEYFKLMREAQPDVYPNGSKDS